MTRNRDDFVALTLRFFEERKPHAGVLILPSSIPNRYPDGIAASLERYVQRVGVERMQPYTVDFLKRV